MRHFLCGLSTYYSLKDHNWEMNLRFGGGHCLLYLSSCFVLLELFCGVGVMQVPRSRC